MLVLRVLDVTLLQSGLTGFLPALFYSGQDLQDRVMRGPGNARPAKSRSKFAPPCKGGRGDSSSCVLKNTPPLTNTKGRIEEGLCGDGPSPLA